MKEWGLFRFCPFKLWNGFVAPRKSRAGMKYLLAKLIRSIVLAVVMSKNPPPILLRTIAMHRRGVLPKPPHCATSPAERNRSTSPLHFHRQIKRPCEETPRRRKPKPGLSTIKRCDHVKMQIIEKLDLAGRHGLRACPDSRNASTSPFLPHTTQKPPETWYRTVRRLPAAINFIPRGEAIIIIHLLRPVRQVRVHAGAAPALFCCPSVPWARRCCRRRRCRFCCCCVVVVVVVVRRSRRRPHVCGRPYESEMKRCERAERPAFGGGQLERLLQEPNDGSLRGRSVRSASAGPRADHPDLRAFAQPASVPRPAAPSLLCYYTDIDDDLIPSLVRRVENRQPPVVRDRRTGDLQLLRVVIAPAGPRPGSDDDRCGLCVWWTPRDRWNTAIHGHDGGPSPTSCGRVP